MKLYSHHPSAMRLDDPNLIIDPTKGNFWESHPAYREALLKFQTLVGTDQFLWCEIEPTFNKMAEDHDLVRWEIEVPFDRILAFYRASVWEAIFNEKEDADWSHLLITPTEAEVIADHKDTLCIVRVPVENPKAVDMIPLNAPRPSRYGSRPKP